MTVKQRKMMCMLPLLVIPFLTLAFWALGGGTRPPEVSASEGLNLELPDAKFKDEKAMDKLGFYDQAEKDSLKLLEWKRSDPYFNTDTVPHLEYPHELEELTTITAGKYQQRLNPSPYDKGSNHPEDQLLQKLKWLQDEINKPAVVESVPEPDDPLSGELDRLESMLQVHTGNGDDPEMQQLQGTLDKILDIQHPERVRERSVKNPGAVYAVRRETGADTLVKGFYSYSNEMEVEEPNALEAIIATHQTIVNGAVVKFRTASDLYVNGKLIRKDHIISGIATLEGERLRIEIKSIRSGSHLFNVKLEVYDMDGLPGIHIPGTINREVAKESLNNSLSLADMTTLDPSLKAQATATGVVALKSLISKKSKLIRVQVKAGYTVLLKNQQ